MTIYRTILIAAARRIVKIPVGLFGKRSHKDIAISGVVHPLKTVRKYWTAVKDGRKPFEVRLNDRNYTRGDIVVLREYDDFADVFTGRSLTRKITYVLRGPELGIAEGWCVFGLAEL